MVVKKGDPMTNRPKLLRWRKSDDGYGRTRCGRYWYTPSYAGCVNPQDYTLWWRDPATGESKRLAHMEATQRDCKKLAEEHAWEQLAKEDSNVDHS